MKTHRPNLRQQFHILLAGCREDEERTLKQWLLTNQPSVQVNCVSTPDEALTHLEIRLVESFSFPRLVLLGLSKGNASEMWSLVEQLKDRYHWLPLVLLSDDDGHDPIQRAHQLGVNVFVSRMGHLVEWQEKLKELAHYLFRLITLPRPFVQLTARLDDFKL